jgi:hypothetical protein
MHMDPCFPPHPAVSPPPCLIKPCVKGGKNCGPHPHHIIPPHLDPIPPGHHVPSGHHPVVPHPVVPHNPVSPPHVTPVPKADPKSLASFFFFE